MLHRPRHAAQTLFALAAAAILVAGCAPGAFDRGGAEFEALSADARQLEEARDWTAAAEAWQRAAEAARGANRDAALVAAAEAWLRAGQAERARSALAGVSAQPGDELEARGAVIEARLLLRDDRAAEALARLAELPTGPGDPVAEAILATRADAAFASRRPVIGVAALVQRETLLTDPERQGANQRRLWNRLQEAASAGVSLATPPGTDPVVAAWLELGRIAADSAGNLFRLRAGLLDWRERHPEHPAGGELIERLLAEYRAMTEYPRNIALLLPLDGRQAAAASAVRDGFIAGYLAQGDEGERPALRVYDTTTLGPLAAYELAARNGADFIIGPLLKEELAELPGAELPPVPTLALNWAEEGVVLPAYMFQFALAPEEEAVAAALRALQDGHRRALVLATDTDQGRRLARSFVDAFRAEGGEVLGQQLFDPREQDFSFEITGLLLIDESRARYQRIQAALGRRLEYVPRRRQDADFLFLAARPSEGRLIRPQLRFHYASQLPVYSTSLIYDPTGANQADLDGVMFSDMPWRVGAGDMEFMAQFRAFGRNALDRNGRLYAFGADAYRLVPLLHNRSGALDAGVDGLTGVLRVGSDGRVHRELEWGRFRDGRVQHAPPELPLVEAPERPGS
ncbi:MAG TPA: penicillin-binding protein activator [Gammaproteobacteria bacterium]|nr:penicillin-binding protein activator [Gammaproteobacteria bacterium]